MWDPTPRSSWADISWMEPIWRPTSSYSHNPPSTSQGCPGTNQVRLQRKLHHNELFLQKTQPKMYGHVWLLWGKVLKQDWRASKHWKWRQWWGGSRFVRSKISSGNDKHFLNKTVLFKHYFLMSFHLNFASALDNKVIYIRPAHFSAANTNLWSPCTFA